MIPFASFHNLQRGLCCATVKAEVRCKPTTPVFLCMRVDAIVPFVFLCQHVAWHASVASLADIPSSAVDLMLHPLYENPVAGEPMWCGVENHSRQKKHSALRVGVACSVAVMVGVVLHFSTFEAERSTQLRSAILSRATATQRSTYVSTFAPPVRSPTFVPSSVAFASTGDADVDSSNFETTELSIVRDPVCASPLSVVAKR